MYLKVECLSNAALLESRIDHTDVLLLITYSSRFIPQSVREEDSHIPLNGFHTYVPPFLGLDEYRR
jgi:hypothetical protein